MSEQERPLSMGEWLVTLLILTFVPCVNIVMMFVWGFGNGNVNRKRFCQAYLIIWAIMVVLMIILYGTVFSALMKAMTYY
ncbi:MAG: hypothetical protein HFI05_11975 [Lachnospiraceae bacterium]|nr:hypothetical protein [Lachnospiraceae bacterium]